MKTFYDNGHTNKEFSIGEWVYLRPQPYRQVSAARRNSQKLSPRSYGPYQIIERIGKVAYKLNLPEGGKVHPVFHVSLLKKQLGARNLTGTQLPDMKEDT